MKRYIILLIVVLLYGCTREEIKIPQAYIGEPIFIIDAILDNEPLNFKAGIENYYLFTEWEKDLDGIYTYVGRFEKDNNCTGDCIENIQFEIRDISVENNLTFINQTITLGNLPFKDNTTLVEDITQVQYELETDVEEPEQIIWRYQENTSLAPPFRKFNTEKPIFNFKNTVIYDVESSVRNNDNLTASLLRPFSHEQVYDCTIDYTVKQLQNGQLELDAIPNSSSNIDGYIWLYDLNLSVEPTFTITPLDDPSIFCTLTANYANGCFAELTRTFKQGEDGVFDYINVNHQREVRKVIEDGTQLHLGTFALQYTDVDGTIFRSDFQNQPNSSFVEVLEVEEYERNEKGQKTKKVVLKFNCTLFGNDGSEKNVKSDSTILAVAYPEI